MKNLFSKWFLCVLMISISAVAQYQIKGRLLETPNQKIQLMGFNGFQVYLINEATMDENGNFSLEYQASDYGIGYLNIAEKENLILVLANENIELKAKKLSEKESIEFTKGEENKLYLDYLNEFAINQNTLGAWEYLMETYTSTPHLQAQKETISAIKNEINYLKEADSAFLENLPEDSYIKWFIPIRKMISDVSYAAQQKPELIPEYLQKFRAIQHDNDLFYKSGLYKDGFEGHFWLIENSGVPMDEVYAEMKKSIDIIVDNLAFDDKKMNETGEFLFQFLESRKHFEASEYLAVKLLNESSCTLNANLENQLEVYRKMKSGMTAANILFEGDVFKSGRAVEASELKDIPGEYYLVAFGSSWCPACVKELPKLQDEYANFQKKGVEIVMISLDTSKTEFQKFTKNFDFYAAADYKKWNTQAVTDYYVFSTPTLYLIDKNRKILRRPNSVEQAKEFIAKLP